MGTIQNKKQRGKRARRKARVPKETIKAPSHHRTSASMFSESGSSRCSGKICNLANSVATTAATSKIKPGLARDSAEDSEDFHSRNINVALTGRISNMWVYWASLRARAREEMRELHPITKETATRTEKRNRGDTLEIDSRVELVSTMEYLRNRIRESPAVPMLESSAQDLNSASCFFAFSASLELGLSFNICCNCCRARVACPLFA